MFQWLGLWALTAKGLGSIPDWGTKIPQATKYGKKKKKKIQNQIKPGTQKAILKAENKLK